MAIAVKIGGFLSQSSLIRKMFEEGLELKKQYGPQNVYDFSLGNPDVPPPRLFQEELERIVSAEIPGKHAYMPNAGYPETRQAVAEHLCRVHGKPLNVDSVVMTCGAGAALNVIFRTLLDPGDEVLAPAPCFVEYGFYVDNAGGIPRVIPSLEAFSLDLAGLEAAMTRRTKAVLINYPNNPTGKVYDEASLRGLADLLERKSREFGRTIYLVSDEPYSDIVYDGVVVPSVLALYPASLIASSYSKTLSLAGERIGYIAVNPEVEDAEVLTAGLVLGNRMLGFVNAPALMQRVGARLQGVTVDTEVYRRKRDRFCDGLRAAGYELTTPQGAFYLFPKAPVPDDKAFVQALKAQRVLTVPGSAFLGPGHFRIAYCVADEVIERSLEGFAAAIQPYR
jgi:aspartate aminotransferase